MLLCSVADIRGRSASAIEDAALGDLIESTSDAIEDYVGAWLAPRPTDPALTTTLLFDVEHTTGMLRPVQGTRVVGIRALTALGIAPVGQPETGGVYTSVPLASVLLRPRPSPEGPASMLVLTAPGTFYRGFNTVTATGSFGPAAVSSQVRETTIQMVLLTLAYNPGLVSQRIGDWSEAYSAGADYVREREAIFANLSAPFAV